MFERSEEVKHHEGSIVSKERVKELTEKQDEIDKAEDEQLEANSKAREKQGFLKRLSVHNKPAHFIYVGLLFSFIAGSLLPSFGVWFAKMLFIL